MPGPGWVVLASKFTFSPCRYEHGGGPAPSPITFLLSGSCHHPTGLFFTACCQDAGQLLGKVREEIRRLGAVGESYHRYALTLGLMEITLLWHSELQPRLCCTSAAWSRVSPLMSLNCPSHPCKKDKCSSLPTYCMAML